MTDGFIGTPGSVQRDMTSREKDRQIACQPVSPARLADHAATADIAEIAYALWQSRGCPSNSAGADWLEAEEIVRQRVNLG